MGNASEPALMSSRSLRQEGRDRWCRTSPRRNFWHRFHLTSDSGHTTRPCHLECCNSKSGDGLRTSGGDSMNAPIADRLAGIAAALDLRALVRNFAQATGPAWAVAIPADRARRIRRLVISGCGDSMFAAVGARLAFERFGGVPCEPMDALECGRYGAARFGPDVAVLGISNSGTTSRVLESVALAARTGAFTLALTGTAGSPLERLVEASIVRSTVGAGPSYGTALFGAGKLVEEVPMCSVPQHLEEWAHLEYFLTMVEGARTRAVVVAPPGASTDRAVEILKAIRADGGVAIAVTHPRQDPVRHAAAASLTVDGDIWEGYTPLPYAVPMQLLSIALALYHGRAIVPLSRGDGGRLIRESAARDLPQV